MKNLSAILTIILLFGGCSPTQNQIRSSQSEIVESMISVGGNIYEAKTKLIQKGFRIDYGPDFPTKTERYLMMIVDYGIRPSGLDTFKYTLGIGSEGKPVDGIIEADPDGTITSIE